MEGGCAASNCRGVRQLRTFLPYRERASALIATNFSPPMEKPLAKASSGFVNATARELISSWVSCGWKGASQFRDPRVTFWPRIRSLWLGIGSRMKRGNGVSYREGRGLGLKAGEVCGENAGLVELTGAHQAVGELSASIRG
jgi:hypothetical protein